MPLGEADVRTIFSWLSPEYMIEAAKEHGSGDPVRGAFDAYSEVTRQIRSFARYVAWRDDEPVAGLGLAMALRAMGYLGRPQPLGDEIATDWRRTAEAAFTDGSAAMLGEVVVPVGEARQDHVSLALMLAVSRCLTFHVEHCNRARLQGRVFQRLSPEILVHVETAADQVRSVLLAPARVAPERLASRWLRSLKGLRKVEGHWLRPLAGQLLRAWAEAGFIASPAGAMVSLVGAAGVQRGWAPLFPANGIPLAITLGRAGKEARIGLTADHRVLDATGCGKVYEYLAEEMPRCLSLFTRPSKPRSTPRTSSSVRSTAGAATTLPAGTAQARASKS